VTEIKVNVSAYRFSGSAREKNTAAGGSATEVSLIPHDAKAPHAMACRGFALSRASCYCRHSKQPKPGTQPPPGGFTADLITLPRVDLTLTDPVPQRLGVHPQPFGHRRDRRPLA
jgi:hypothetical protein